MQRSEAINDLAAALAKARGEFDTVFKSANNPFFKSKYADLAEILNATVKHLSKNGLAVIQSPGEVVMGPPVMVKVETILLHTSGQWMSDTLTMPVAKPDAQGIGSAITYARRYAYGALVNVASEIDDDANAATGKAHQAEALKDFQVRSWNAALQTTQRTKEEIAAKLMEHGCKSVENIDPAKFDLALRWLSRPAADLTSKLAESVEHIKKVKKPKPVNGGDTEILCEVHGPYEGGGNCPYCHP